MLMPENVKVNPWIYITAFLSKHYKDLSVLPNKFLIFSEVKIINKLRLK